MRAPAARSGEAAEEREKKERKLWREREKKREILGGPAEGVLVGGGCPGEGGPGGGGPGVGPRRVGAHT